jgi:transcriptional regulator with XRE-family HTH domain
LRATRPDGANHGPTTLPQHAARIARRRGFRNEVAEDVAKNCGTRPHSAAAEDFPGRNAPSRLARKQDRVEAEDKLELQKANLMGKPTPVVPSRNEALGQALKSLRRLRARRPGEMAVLLGISRRSYEYFEAGRGPINVDRVHRFAQILDVDPFAILAAAEIRSPQFAMRCAEHKLMTVMMVAVQEFDAAAGDDIGRLNAAAIISGLTRVFDALAKEARDGEAFAERWLGEADAPPTPPGPAVARSRADEPRQPDDLGSDRPPSPSSPDDPDD